VLSKLRGLREMFELQASGAIGCDDAGGPAAAGAALEAFATNELVLKRGRSSRLPGCSRSYGRSTTTRGVCEAPGTMRCGRDHRCLPSDRDAAFRLDFFGDEIETSAVSTRSHSDRRAGGVDRPGDFTRVKLDQSTTGIADYLSPATHLYLSSPWLGGCRWSASGNGWSK